MAESQDRQIADMEVAEAATVDRERSAASAALPAVAAFIGEYGEDALHVALQAGPLFRGLRSESRWALETALSASGTRGVNGYLVVRLPRMPNDLTEMSFLTGAVELNLGFHP